MRKKTIILRYSYFSFSNVYLSMQDPNTGFMTNTPLEVFTITPGRRYRFRLINSYGSVCPAQITVEGHTLTIIATDGEAVQPVQVNTIISFSGKERFYSTLILTKLIQLII